MTTVLVVDDEPDIVLFARVNLELAGYDVIEANDGEAALDAVREQRPDVVLLDVMMPRLDGWSVLERLKADPDPDIRTIPVVMLTALGDDQHRVRGGIEGAVRYLPKPVTPDAVLGAIADVLAGGPEPDQRKKVQQAALTELARMERGDDATLPPQPGPRLSRLERLRSAEEVEAAASTPTPAVVLSDSQRALLRGLLAAPSVSEAAHQMGMSRSNVYASLRRIGRKLHEPDASRLLRRLRAGELAHLLQD